LGEKKYGSFLEREDIFVRREREKGVVASNFFRKEGKEVDIERREGGGRNALRARGEGSV